jgi:hypothetical protein
MKPKYVSHLPKGHPAYHDYVIKLEHRGEGLWAVTHKSRILNRDGGWDDEPRPSEQQSARWLTSHSFFLPSARMVAKRAAPHVKVNNCTATEVLAGRKATAVARSLDWFGDGVKYEEDPKNVRKHGHQALCRTKDGRWNLNSWPAVGKTDGSEDGTYEYVDDETAKAWLRRNGHAAAIERWYGAAN